jgi:hypothetical protein
MSIRNFGFKILSNMFRVQKLFSSSYPGIPLQIPVLFYRVSKGDPFSSLAFNVWLCIFNFRVKFSEDFSDVNILVLVLVTL